ncbi:tyrosine-type recombinase/integrase [Enterococcus larvae]|uniref:tyrosine-type recombinase/integrase n=1 Tax=Enterococcus larvae TaxID=2794352 RepID=UPI003F2B8DCA
MNKKPLDKELFFSKTCDYLKLYLARQCNKSEHTIKAYRDALTVFRRFVLEEKKLTIMTFKFEDCTRDLVLEFISYLKGKKYAESTINQRLSALKAYLWYVGDDNLLVQSTALTISRVPFLKVPKLTKPTLPDGVLASMLAAPKNSKLGIRDRTMMVLLYDSAIRMEELLGLNIGDLNLTAKDPYIRIRGKGDKERIVAITEKTVGHLQLYKKYYHDASPAKTALLFYTVINGKRKQMSPSNFERIIKKYADIVRPSCPDMPEKVYPHLYRRTRATNLYQDGVELELISRILGHSSTETTRIYAAPSVEMMRKAMENAEVAPKEMPLWEGDEDELAKFCGLR